ncbi:MAG: DUF4835 family protein [Bacteroidota bacterium]
MRRTPVKYLIALANALLFQASVLGQELNCRVVVNAEQIQITERAIFTEMETEFALFLNTEKWTEDEFLEEEVINANLVINISEMPSIGSFQASAQVLVGRPVYGTDLQTVILNFADRDFIFNYVQSQPIRFNPNAFTDNLTSLLAYYAYIILGFDYDSFSDLGGNPHFDKAFEIVNNAQQSNFPGWQQFSNLRNRYWLIDNLRNPQLEPIRKATYTYHRLGLDLMLEEREEAEKNILAALSTVQKVNKTVPRAVVTLAFMDAKASEIASIFQESPISRRRQAYTILNNIDPSKSDQFKSLIE